MNPNDSELESQLRALLPRPASPTLEQNIATELACAEIVPAARVPAAAVLRRTTRVRSSLPGWLNGIGWAFAGAIVALAAVTLGARFQAAPPEVAVSAAPAAEFEHAASSEELVNATDEGVVVDDDEFLRQVHYYTLERHVWVNPQTGARVEVEIPREDVRFTPVAMQ